jgi:hypothetical protein
MERTRGRFVLRQPFPGNSASSATPSWQQSSSSTYSGKHAAKKRDITSTQKNQLRM